MAVAARARLASRPPPVKAAPRAACGAGIPACQFTGHPCPVFLLPPRYPSAEETGGRMPPELAGWKPAPQPRRARPMECGDWSPLSRRRLVAVKLPPASARARVPPLARAVNAPAAQVSKPAVSPISQSAAVTNIPACAASPGVAGDRPACGFGNPRYSRLGSLRYKGPCADAPRSAAFTPQRRPHCHHATGQPTASVPFHASAA